VVARDASVVENLRKAGAVIMGKASLSEWYKFRSLSHVPNGWCARSGQGVVSSLISCLQIFFLVYLVLHLNCL
jgi:amidase